MIMKVRLFLFALILCVINLSGFAKEGKLKVGKQLVYIGTVENKAPAGHGTLTALNPSTKDAYCTINGEFNGFNQVKNPTLTLEGRDEISSMGIALLSIDNQKPCNLVLNLSGTKMVYNNQSYTINGQSIKLSQEKNGWKIEVDMTDPAVISSELIALLEAKNLLNIKNNKAPFIIYGDKDLKEEPILEKLGYKIDKAFRIFSRDKALSPITPNIYLVKKAGSESDHYIYAGNQLMNLNNPSITCEISPYNGSWSGIVVAGRGNESVAIIRESASKPDVTIYYTQEKHYKGTIKDVDKVVAADFDLGHLKFDNGTMIDGDKTDKWINSVSETEIRSQLSSYRVESDLVDSVLSGNMTIDNAISNQQVRDEQKRHNQKLAREEFAKHWTGTEVLFKGNLVGTQEGNSVFQMLFGIDNTYFTGVAALCLNNSGEARFVVGAEPSKKAYQEGRGRGLQVLGACERINKDISGQWSIEGNKLYINGDEQSIRISTDYMTFTYEGMLGAKMKLNQQR